MASAGSHKATVTLDGKVSGLDKAMRTANERIAKLEDALEKAGKAATGAGSKFDRFDAAVEKAGKASASAGSSLGDNLLGKLRDLTVVGRGAIDTLSSVASTIGQLADEGVEAQNIFQNLPFSIDKARESTLGYVDDLTLAKFATTLNRTEVAKSADEYARFAGAAVKLGSSVGLGPEESMNSLTAALARGSTEMLDNLGIVLKTEQAQREYAAQLGKTRGQLDEAQKAEAFRKVGMQRVIDAAEGVTVTTDGAAAAVARFNVELENIKTKALAGDSASRTLDHGVSKLALTMRVSTDEVRKGEEAYFDFKDALTDLGVDTSEMYSAQNKFADALDLTRTRIRSNIKDALIANSVTEEQVEQMRALLEVDKDLSETDRKIFEQRVAEADARKTEGASALDQQREELHLLDLSIATLQGQGEEEDYINELLQDRAELMATILESEGKAEEAARVRRQAELDAARAAGAQLRKKSGGRRKDVELDLDVLFGNTEARLARLDAQEERALRLLERRGEGAQKRFDALARKVDRGKEAMAELGDLLASLDQRATPDPFSLEAFGAVKEGEQERQLAAAERMFEIQMRQLEMQEAEQKLLALQGEGEEMSPIAKIEAETEARLALLDVQERAANDTLDVERIADQRRAELHQLEMARLQEKIRAQEESHAKLTQFATQQANLHMGIAGAAIRAAVLEEGSVRKKIAGIAKTNAVEFGLIQGPRELILAAISAASGNPVGAAAHLANAGAAFAFAASMGVIAGAAGGFSKTPGHGGGFTAASFGPGGGGGSRGGGPSPSGAQSDHSPIPPSPSPGAPSAPAANAGGGGPLVINNNGNFYGSPSKEFTTSIVKAIRDRGYGYREVG